MARRAPTPFDLKTKVPVATRLRLAMLLRTFVMLAGFCGVVTFIAINSERLQPPTPMSSAIIVDENFSTPEKALDALKKSPQVNSAANRQSTKPVWVFVSQENLRHTKQADLLIVGDKSVRKLSTWSIGPSGQPKHLETTIRSASAITRTQSFDRGFYIPTDILQGSESLLLRVTTVGGSAKVQVGLQSRTAFSDSMQARERLAAALAGALLALAAFTATIASFTRNSALAASAFWIVALLGVTSISLGYDLMWLHYEVPAIVELRFKQMILALMMISTCLLFQCLFRSEMARLSIAKRFGSVSRAVNLVLPIAALLLPTALFVPTFWVLSIAVLIYFGMISVRIATKFHTPKVHIFCWSWASISLCLIAEVAYASGLMSRIPGLSFETGAIIGAFLAASAAAATFHYERKRRVAAMSRSRDVTRQYREIYHQVPTGLITLDDHYQVTQTNPAAREMFAPTELDGTDFSDYVNFQISGHSLSQETRPLRDGSGTIELVHHNRTLSLESIRTPAGMQIAVIDVTARAKLQDTLEHQASHDHLTGALSWFGLSKSLSSAVEPDLQEGKAWVVLHIMISNFRAIVKLHGRQAGDVFLREASRRIRETSSKDGYIARLGNEEFVLVAPTRDRQASIDAAGNFIQSIIGKPFMHQAAVVNLSVKAGVAFATSMVNAEDALLHAQRACDEIGQDDINTVSVFDESGPTNERLRNEHYWDDFILSSEYGEYLELWAQPIVPLAQSTETVRSLEVLLRVRTNDGRLHSPAGVLDAARRHSIIPDLDLLILRRTLEFLENNQSLCKKVDYVSVNLSGASVNSRSFLRKMANLLAEYPNAVGSLCIEITESIALIDLPATRAFTDEMSELGVRLALDDFGSGYTSFAYLRSVPAQVLKMDGAFVRDLEKDAKAQSVAAGIISLAHSLGMTCVAEWVESEATAERLRSLGCDFAQGFHFGAAEPISHWVSSDEPIHDDSDLQANPIEAKTVFPA